MASLFLFNESLMLFLVAITIQITLLILVVMSGMWMLRPKSAALRHGVWLGTLLAVVVFPGMTYLMRQTRTEIVDLRETARDFGALTTWAQPVGTTSASSTSDAAPSVKTALPSPPTATAGASIVATVTETPGVDDQTRTDLMKIGVFSLWIAGIGLGLFRLNFGWYVARGLKHDSEIVRDERIARPFDAAIQLLHVKRPPPLLTSSRVSTPLVVGIVRPAIVLPAGMADELDRVEIQHILIHELAHVIRRDNIVGLLQRLVGIIWWPHPLMHYLNRMLSRAREEVCDNYALLHGDRHLYARTLLHVSQQFRASAPLASTVGLLHSKWKLEQRIAGLLDAGRSLMLKPGRRRMAGLIVLWCAGAVLFSGATVTAPTQEEAVAHLTALGCKIYSRDGFQKAEGTDEVWFPEEFSGTTDDLIYLKSIKGIKKIYFVGANLTEINLEDLPELEEFVLIGSAVDAQGRQVEMPFVTRKISLKNLPKLKSGGKYWDRHLKTLNSLELVDMPALTELDIQGSGVTDRFLASLSGAPNLTKLRASRNFFPTDPTGRTLVTDEGVNKLGSLSKLKELDLSGGQITDASLKTIGQFTSLVELGLASTEITDAGLPHLKNLRNLKTLFVDGDAITDDGLKTIVANHPQLEYLELGGTRITPAGIEDLRPLQNLKTLSLSTDQLNEVSCSIIASLSLKRLGISGHSQQAAEISGLPNIEALFVWGAKNVEFAPNSLANLNRIICRATGSETTRGLFRHFQYLKKLEHLEIGRGPNADGSFDENGSVYVDDAMLKQMQHLTELKSFQIEDQHKLTGTGIMNLVPLEHLEQLFLTNSIISDNDAMLFSQMRNLKYLSLFGSKITNQGLYHFQNMKQLKMLNLNNTSIDQDAAFTFRREFLPDTEVQAGY